MNRLTLPILALAVLTVACGGTVMSSAKAQPASVAGAAQINQGANAGSDISDVNRVNPTITKAGPTQPARPQTRIGVASQPASSAPSSGSSRCGGGATGVGGNRASGGTGTGRTLPLPMCAVE